MSKNNSRYLKQYCRRINTNYYIIRYLNSAIKANQIIDSFLKFKYKCILAATINKPYDFMDDLIQYYFGL